MTTHPDDMPRQDVQRFLAELMAQTNAPSAPPSPPRGDLDAQVQRFIEELFTSTTTPCLPQPTSPRYRVLRRARAYDDARNLLMKIDLLLISGEHAIAIAYKTRLQRSDVDEHIERLTHFKATFPEYADKILLGVIAVLGAAPPMVDYAERQGLYVLAQTADTVVVKNRPGFVPKSW